MYQSKATLVVYALLFGIIFVSWFANSHEWSQAGRYAALGGAIAVTGHILTTAEEMRYFRRLKTEWWWIGFTAKIAGGVLILMALFQA